MLHWRTAQNAKSSGSSPDGFYFILERHNDLERQKNAKNIEIESKTFARDPARLFTVRIVYYVRTKIIRTIGVRPVRIVCIKNTCIPFFKNCLSEFFHYNNYRFVIRTVYQNLSTMIRRRVCEEHDRPRSVSVWS